MQIGYACIALEVPDTALKSCIMKNATQDRLISLISNNLFSLENLISYNQEHNIKLFRISSDLIPFGSSPVNTLPWHEIFGDKFNEIGELIKKYSIRVSMHPGQYTVLNSPDKNVVERSIADLEYHAKILELLNTNTESKIILHIGGVYGDKNAALKRFCTNLAYLDTSVKNRIVIENDERSYNISDILEISEKINIPAVFDNLHHSINSSGENITEYEWITLVKKTWKAKDGQQKIHYAQQNPNGRIGSHSDTIDTNKFLQFYSNLHDKDIDIMLEVKDKNISALKCLAELSKNELQ